MVVTCVCVYTHQVIHQNDAFRLAQLSNFNSLCSSACGAASSSRPRLVHSLQPSHFILPTCLLLTEKWLNDSKAGWAHMRSGGNQRQDRKGRVLGHHSTRWPAETTSVCWNEINMRCLHDAFYFCILFQLFVSMLQTIAMASISQK